MKRKNLLHIFWGTAFLSVALYWGVARLIGGHPINFSPGPCSEPLTYTVGHIDTRFSVSEDDIHTAMKKAGTLWSDAAQKTLLKQAEDDGSIMVRFVYDEEQEMADNELRARERIRSEQGVLDNMQSSYDRDRDLFDRRSEKYLNMAKETTEKLNVLNEWVRQINTTGGFSDEEKKEYEQRKAATEQMQRKVLDERAALDRKANSINREIERINKKIEENNRLIDRYNEEFAGESRFTKATFQRVGNGGVITVNQFLSKSELPLVLAHEIGHALGLNHVSNPKSVMFSKMGGQQLYPSVQLSAEDKQAIQNRCGL